MMLFNNSGHSWLMALIAFASTFVVLFAFKKIVLVRLRALSLKTDNQLDDFLVAVLDSITYLFIIFVAIYTAFNFLKFSHETHVVANKMLFLVFVVQIALTGSHTIKYVMENFVLHKIAGDPANATIIGILVFATKFVFYIVLLLTTLHNFGINITTLVAGLGVGGIAIALAVQNILGDLFASFTIILDKPFLVGDFIVVGENMGNVEKVGIKTTRVRSISGEQLIFPNGQLLQSQIKNFKRMNERRIVFNIGIVYQTESEKLKKIPEIITKIIESQKKTRVERVHFKTYGEFSLGFEIVYWVLDPDFKIYMDIQQAINLDIFEQFKKENINFAYPTQTLYASMMNK